jgi:hypothetical protein
MINQYKRTDVFRCNQDAHRHFQGRVSVYHVMKEKGCYPQGCIYFLWHCVLLEKGNRCIHGFEHTGKMCRGCTYFDEEKVHLQPVLCLDEDSYERFLEDLDTFETWLEEVRYRRMEILGKIHSIKPWFQRILLHNEAHTKLRGHLLVFRKGFIGVTPFEDRFYVRISGACMDRNRFRPGMRVEMKGEVRTDRGRIIIHKPGQVECLSKGWGNPLTRERALVALRTATWLEGQPESCMSCHYGALADVIDRREPDEKRYRRLVCLKGIADPDGCYVRVSGKMRQRGPRPREKGSVTKKGGSGGNRSSYRTR